MCIFTTMMKPVVIIRKRELVKQLILQEKIDTKTDVNRTGKIKQTTEWIAKATQSPIISSVFGVVTNPLCHVRLDLN